MKTVQSERPHNRLSELVPVTDCPSFEQWQSTPIMQTRGQVAVSRRAAASVQTATALVFGYPRTWARRNNEIASPYEVGGNILEANCLMTHLSTISDHKGRGLSRAQTAATPSAVAYPILCNLLVVSVWKHPRINEHVLSSRFFAGFSSGISCTQDTRDTTPIVAP